MKTLTIKQPWASLIMAGVKRVENRTWTTHHRGPLAIHAGKSVDRDACEFLESVGIDPEPYRDAPRGVILGTVELVDVGMPYEFALQADPLAFGPYCWILADPQPLPEPIAARGFLHLWDCDDVTP